MSHEDRDDASVDTLILWNRGIYLWNHCVGVNRFHEEDAEADDIGCGDHHDGCLWVKEMINTNEFSDVRGDPPCRRKS